MIQKSGLSNWLKLWKVEKGGGEVRKGPKGSFDARVDGRHYQNQEVLKSHPKFFLSVFQSQWIAPPPTAQSPGIFPGVSLPDPDLPQCGCCQVLPMSLLKQCPILRPQCHYPGSGLHFPPSFLPHLPFLSTIHTAAKFCFLKVF